MIDRASGEALGAMIAIAQSWWRGSGGDLAGRSTSWWSSWMTRALATAAHPLVVRVADEVVGYFLLVEGDHSEDVYDRQLLPPGCLHAPVARWALAHGLSEGTMHRVLTEVDMHTRFGGPLTIDVMSGVAGVPASWAIRNTLAALDSPPTDPTTAHTIKWVNASEVPWSLIATMDRNLWRDHVHGVAEFTISDDIEVERLSELAALVRTGRTEIAVIPEVTSAQPRGMALVLHPAHVRQVIGSGPATEGSTYLHHVWVAPAHRGAGLGTRLVDAASTRAIELGAPRLLFHFYSPFAATAEFWRRRGARPVVQRVMPP